MSLQNTLNLAEINDSTQVQEMDQQFNDLINNNNFIVFVVIGTDEKSKTLAAKADMLASSSAQGVQRKVVWVKDHELLRDSCLNMLGTSLNFKEEDYERVAGFTLSPQQNQAKYILYNDSIIQPIHVGLAFWMASRE